MELNCEAISFTYNEPTVFYEWVYDVAKLAQERGLKTYFHTNGAINPEPLRALLEHLDAVCVDLKAFTAEFYEVTSFSELSPVLTTLKTIKEAGVWFEITNLVIPTLNDDMEKIREMCIWIRDNLGKGVPLHFSRFFPAYKLTRLPPTPIETLEKAREIALEVGLEYVTIGNVPGHEANSTFCPQCGETLIERVHFEVLANHIENGRCQFCGHPIPGVWQ
jgi:pyruvate formate lyase activating enzyme